MAAWVSNPELFGEDIMAAAWIAAGVAASGAVNDKIVAPVVGGILPASFRDETSGKVVDALSTAGTGWLLGEVVGMVDRSIGRRTRSGGVILGVAKLMSIVLPGFALTGSLPGAVVSRIPAFGGGKVADTKALAPPVGSVAMNPSLISITGTTGL